MSVLFFPWHSLSFWAHWAFFLSLESSKQLQADLEPVPHPSHSLAGREIMVCQFALNTAAICSWRTSMACNMQAPQCHAWWLELLHTKILFSSCTKTLGRIFFKYLCMLTLNKCFITIKLEEKLLFAKEGYILSTTYIKIWNIYFEINSSHLWLDPVRGHSQHFCAAPLPGQTCLWSQLAAYMWFSR